MPDVEIDVPERRSELSSQMASVGAMSVPARCLDPADGVRRAPVASSRRRAYLSQTLPSVFATLALGLLVGCAPAEYRLSSCLSFAAVPELRRAAEQGDAEAQHDLALYHLSTATSGVPDGDECTPREYYARRSLAWLRLPIGQGDPEAVKWFRRAADQGHALAQLRLGRMYAYGLGVSQDDHQAAAWWRRAADQWRRAADRGDSNAQFYLGHMYHHGYGVSQDDSRAVAWWRRAAVQLHPDAMRVLEKTENVPPPWRAPRP